jgi:hypothetical protein
VALKDAIELYAEGRITAQQVVNQVRPRSPRRPQPYPADVEGCYPEVGTWDEIEYAALTGDISEAQYTDLFHARPAAIG